jgi:hypothetical protein
MAGDEAGSIELPKVISPHIAGCMLYQVAEEREVVNVGAGLVPARRARKRVVKKGFCSHRIFRKMISDLLVAIGRDEPCPYILSLVLQLGISVVLRQNILRGRL